MHPCRCILRLRQVWSDRRWPRHGPVVFPEAEVKIFLDASAEERAQRRYKQLQDKGFDVNFERLLTEIRERDDRDRNRATAPLKPAEDAWW